MSLLGLFFLSTLFCIVGKVGGREGFKFGTLSIVGTLMLIRSSLMPTSKVHCKVHSKLKN
jgi:hypothetical protein